MIMISYSSQMICSLLGCIKLHFYGILLEILADIDDIFHVSWRWNEQTLLHIIFDLAIEGRGPSSILGGLLKAPYLGLGNDFMEGDSPFFLSLVSKGEDAL